MDALSVSRGESDAHTALSTMDVVHENNIHDTAWRLAQLARSFQTTYVPSNLSHLPPIREDVEGIAGELAMLQQKGVAFFPERLTRLAVVSAKVAATVPVLYELRYCDLNYGKAYLIFALSSGMTLEFSFRDQLGVVKCFIKHKIVEDNLNRFSIYLPRSISNEEFNVRVTIQGTVGDRGVTKEYLWCRHNDECSFTEIDNRQ